MENIVKNKLLWIVIALTMFNVGVFVVGKLVVNKAANEVIERLEKDYSPSPYGPGFDPDKVDPEVLRNQELYYEIKINQPEPQTMEGIPQEAAFVVSQTVVDAEIWQEQWERDRGFSQ